MEQSGSVGEHSGLPVPVLPTRSGPGVAATGHRLSRLLNVSALLRWPRSVRTRDPA